MNTVISQHNEITAVVPSGRSATAKLPDNTTPVKATVSFYLADNTLSAGGSGWGTGQWSSTGWGS